MIRELWKVWRFLGRHPLTRDARLAAAVRFLRWQAGSRILGAGAVVPFIESTVLCVDPGMAGATGNIYCGLHEFEDMAFVLHFLREGDCFLNVGANVGTYSILAAGVCGASVLAVEPVPSSHGKLLRNVRINGLQDRIRAPMLAAGAAPGKIQFTADRDTMNQVAPPEYQGRTIEVEVDTLDRLAAGFRATMWKVDVEGFEAAVLRGAQQVLRDGQLQAVLLEGREPAVRTAMADAGFLPAVYNPITRELKEGEANPGDPNQLWIRNWAAVADRCKAARKFTAVGRRF